MREAWGCTGKGKLLRPSFVDERQVVIDKDNSETVQDHYWGCPLKFVPSSIWQFKAQLADFERFPNLLTLRCEQRNPVWNDALRVYDCEYADAMREVRAHG